MPKYKLYICKYSDQLDDSLIGYFDTIQELREKMEETVTLWEYPQVFIKICHPTGKEETFIR
jgi:hypothetical protein